MSLDPGLVDGGGTSLAMGGETGAWSQDVAGAATEGSAEPSVDAAFKLQVEEGATVNATFPFFGDLAGSQLTFQIGDAIQVLQKDELWSWGKLEKSGEEGWFPHNYVQAAFQPLPGMHELKQRVLIKKVRDEAIARGDDPDLAEAAFLNGGVAPTPAMSTPAPEPAPAPAPARTGLEAGAGLNLSAQGWDWDSLGMGPLAPEQPAPQEDLNNGAAWSNQQGGEPDMFGMWMDDLGEDRSSDGDDNVSVASVTSSDRERRRKERKNIARELLDTEDKYVRMLEALLATIIRPCLGQSPNKTCPLSKEDANEIFGTLRAEEILAINTAFREQLRGRMATLSDETCFGDLFKRFAPFLKMYVEYCTQHENTASRVSLIAAKSDKFSNVLHRARSDPRCQDLDAQSLLIMPIQRIPRYKLLLEGMLKNTEKDHADRPLLQTAIEQISDVASFINDSIKRRENQAKIWDLQAMLSEPIDLATPTRIFIRSGVLTKLGRRYQDREDFFALFNDGLLHAKPATFGTKYVFKRIDPVLQVENVGYLKDKPKALHAFRVVTKGHIYLLSARSAALKQDWVKVLDLAIRGGKRELIHKGPLRVLSLGKEGGIRLAYFYVFNDVVVRGKTLWKGKFKHKETLDITHVDPSFNFDGRHEALLPKDISLRMIRDQAFRVSHKHGSVIVIANSDTDKALWLSALEHQQEFKRKAHIGTVTSSKRIVHEDNFADLDEESPRGSRALSAGNGVPSASSDMMPPSASGRQSGTRSRSPSVEQRQRVAAAAATTFGIGSVEGLNGNGGSSSTVRRAASARDGRKREGSPGATMGPLATTSDILISLESSDDEDGHNTKRTASASARRSLPRQQQQQHSQQMRRHLEGQASVSNGGIGRGNRGRAGRAGSPLPASLTASANGGGGAAGGRSLVDNDLMAILSGPPQSGTPSFHPSSHQMANGPAGYAHPSGLGAGGGNMGSLTSSFSGSNLSALESNSIGTVPGGSSGGAIANDNSLGSSSASGTLSRNRSGMNTSSSMPLLQPPTRDTPPFRSAHENITRANLTPNQHLSARSQAGAANGAMVFHGPAGVAQQGVPQQQPGPGAMVLHGGGQAGGPRAQGNLESSFDQFQGLSQGPFSGPPQGTHEGFGGLGPTGGAPPAQQSFVGGGNMRHQSYTGMPQNAQQQQQFPQQTQTGFSQQYQQPVQQQQQQPQQPQQFVQAPVPVQYMQQPQQQYQQQPSSGIQGRFQGF